MKKVTKEIEAEECKRSRSEEREEIIEVDKDLVQERGFRWIHNLIEEDMNQPDDRDASSHKPKQQIEEEA